jgi:hypothetical protein
LIKERDAFEKDNATSKKGLGSGTETAQFSFKIRSTMKLIKDDVGLLDAYVKKAEKKVRAAFSPGGAKRVLTPPRV